MIVTATLELTSLLNVILENALQIIAANDVHIFLYDGKRLALGAALWADKPQSRPIYTEPRPEGLTYTVARSGKKIVIPNVNKHSLYKNGEDGSANGAILGLPLRSGNRVQGVMTTAFTQPHNFTEVELRILELCGNHAAIAIENARLFEAEKKQRALAEALHETAETLSQSLDLKEVLDRILASAQRIIPHDVSDIALIESDGNLAIARHRGYEAYGLADWMSQWRYSVADNPISKEIAQSKTPVIVPDTRNHDLWVEIPDMG